MHVHVHIHIHVHIHVHIHIYTCMYTDTHLCTSVCVCVCMCVIKYASRHIILYTPPITSHIWAYSPLLPLIQLLHYGYNGLPSLTIDHQLILHLHALDITPGHVMTSHDIACNTCYDITRYSTYNYRLKHQMMEGAD